MTIASVSSIDPARDRKLRRDERKAERTEARQTEALGRAKSPGQVAAVAFDQLRMALAKLAKSDPNAAMTQAWEIHNDLKTRADQINPSRR